MTVRVSKQPINLREKLSELERPIGLKGSELMRAETAQEARDFVSAGRRNFLINGNFVASQRGNFDIAPPSAVGAVDNAYHLDRWKMRITNVSATIQRQLVTLPNNQKVYSYKLAATSSGNGYTAFRQIIEDINALSNQDITLSCWVRGYGASPVYFRHWGATNIGDPIYLTNEWQYVSRQYTFGNLTSLSDGSASGATMAFSNYNNNVAITSGDYFEIAQFQIEVGKNATDFEYRSYGEELALCQRYYQQHTGTGNNVGPWFFQLDGYSASVYRATVHLPTSMRALPSVSWAASGTIGATIGTQFLTETSFTAYTNTGSGSIHINSWSASSEL